MTGNASVTISAPAKINLGLEILGKRSDGYHEIRTVMAMVDLADTLTVTPLEDAETIKIAGVTGISVEDNLIAKAIRAYAAETGIRAGHTVEVEKRIPSPGGLGGASSDAAAMLRALNALHGGALSQEDLARLASGLGSDVPFFLGSTVALARDTGTVLDPLPPVAGWVVLVVPRMKMAAKTQTLYRALWREDFSDGSTVARVVDAIRDGRLPSNETFVNAFSRPLRDLVPALAEIESSMLDSGANHVALSGAGPAHYTLITSESEANALAGRLRTKLSPDTFVTATSFLHQPPAIEIHER